MRIVVIGGGPSGMMAAIAASCEDTEVILIEKNKMLGRKLMITGKGRCNLTNACSFDNLLNNVTRNKKFLYSAFTRFDNLALIKFMDELKIKTKVERGLRVFPESDSSLQVTEALKRHLSKCKVRIRHNRIEKLMLKDKNLIGVHLADDQRLYADKFIIATGGISYPRTGSTGDGYRFAEQCGHSIKKIKASLVPLEICENWARQLSGLTLKNVAIKVFANTLIYTDFGELLFTHFGVSGPIILSASAHITHDPLGYKISIDLKPALSHEQLENRVKRDQTSDLGNKNIKNYLKELLPVKLINIIINICNINPNIKLNNLTKIERKILCLKLKSLDITIKKFRPIQEAIITSGGVCTDEIFSSTMQSKLVNNLYFAGEVIDVDAYTGGFNLQIAFSTGYLAGKSCNNVKD